MLVGSAGNLAVFRSAEVVAQYARANYLTPAEQFLFENYVRPGDAILDLGVGGGRTTRYLSGCASRYVGVDFSEEMIEACRAKFPNLQFEVADASDLSLFADGSFDSVVFSFNGIDSLAPDQERVLCLRECHRVLKRGGTFIFSAHNPRSLIVGWRWNWVALTAKANKLSANIPILSGLMLAGLSCAKLVLTLWRMALQSAPRLWDRITTRTFWLGDGYMLDSTHGGVWCHFAVPERVIAELTASQFKSLQILPEDYPSKGRTWCTRWFYYAFSKL
jgi:SAM-dependent methyltransferase